MAMEFPWAEMTNRVMFSGLISKLVGNVLNLDCKGPFRSTRPKVEREIEGDDERWDGRKSIRDCEERKGPF